jgi:hypothetical protein
MGNVDPKMPFIPAFMMNFFIRKVGSYLFGKIMELAKNLDKPWV